MKDFNNIYFIFSLLFACAIIANSTTIIFSKDSVSETISPRSNQVICEAKKKKTLRIESRNYIMGSEINISTKANNLQKPPNTEKCEEKNKVDVENLIDIRTISDSETFQDNKKIMTKTKPQNSNAYNWKFPATTIYLGISFFVLNVGFMMFL
ncbi:hypothetical protein G9A89_016885 [Geosiphon pyriformis]|nr:hypothetical protein G9A89_016885 [Geosiphon pyriformis]